MSIWRLVLKEIRQRKLNFALGLCSVTVAIGCLVGALTLLRGYDQRTAQILAAKTAETQARMKKLEDDYRKITKNLGFNILILPKDQNLADLYADNFASKYMPEEYVKRLSNSRIVTINHLLPSLQQKVKWPEQERTIILIGIRGEVPFMHRDPKKPIQEAVPKGTIVVGYELHRSLHLKKGQKVKFFGREMTVSKLHEERGNKDDITIWLDLEEAQAILKKQGQINGILALECHCAGDRISKIRKEIAGILPNTQVKEFATKAIARAEARDRATAEAKAAIAAERRNRAKMKQEIQSFAGVLVPVVILGCTVWVGLLTFGNVRERRAEVGILRAIGFRSTQILLVFMTKAVFIGIAGACVGYVAGLFCGAQLVNSPQKIAAADLFDSSVLGLTFVVAPLLAAIASWLPSLSASQQDPAVVLCEE